MYCILVAGIPAAGKSTMAKFLSKQLKLPVISKDTIIEHKGFDTFTMDDGQIKVDTTDFSKIDMRLLLEQIRAWMKGV